MSVDLFGRTLPSKKGIIKGPPGIGFNLTVKGDFDLEEKRLCNVAKPQEPSDAVNLKYLTDAVQKLINRIDTIDSDIIFLNQRMEDLKSKVNLPEDIPNPSL